MALGANAGINGKGQYVYYRDDLPSHHPELANDVALNVAGTKENWDTEWANTGQTLINMAAAEASKEIQLINQCFGGKLPSVNIQNLLYDKDFLRELTNAFNFALQLKSTFARNKYRIKEGLGRVSMYTLIGQYWETEVHNNLTKLVSDITGTKSNSAIGLVCEQYLDWCFDLALEKMFVRATRGARKSDAETSKEESQIMGDYKELYAALQGTGNQFKGQLVKELKEILGIDQLLNELKRLVTNPTELTPSKLRQMKTSASTGGYTAESFTALEQKMVFNKVEEMFSGLEYHFSNGLLSVDVTTTGSSLQKADVIVQVGATGKFQQFTRTGEDKSLRKEAIAHYEKIQSKLANMSEGFIIYENLKNYSSYRSGVIGDFSAGAAISLETFASVAAAAGMGGDFITAIMNIIPGALGDDNVEEIDQAIASTIAYFLFDDVATIGQSYASIGVSGRSIHLFNLSGIYVPLSVFLFKFGETIISGGSIRKFVDVDMTYPAEVLYPFSDFKSPYYGKGRDSSPYWNEQAQEALTETRIAMKFWSSFGSFVKGL